MEKRDLIPLGKIVGTHGIRGLLKVVSYAESVDSFSRCETLWLKRKGTDPVELRVVSARSHKQGLLLALEGVESIESAREWVGWQLCLSQAALPPLEEGTYYWRDIIGLSVKTLEGRRLGKVTAILPTGSNDVYVVKEKGKETLIPAIESVVLRVDLDGGVLHVDLPDGLEDRKQ